MNICFLARPSYDIFSTMIYKNMKKRYVPDLTGIFITSNQKETDYITKNIPDGICCEVSAFMKQNWNSFSLDDLSGMEKKYSCKPIWKYIYTDRFLINRPYDYVVKVTDGLFRFFEYVFTKYNIDVYYSETIATLQCYIAYIVGKKLGTRYLAQMTARGLDSTFLYLLEDEYQGVIGLQKVHTEAGYSNEEKLHAASFLDQFEKSYNEPQNMQFVVCKPQITIKDLFRPILRLVKSFDKTYRDKYAYMYYQDYKHITDPLLFFFRYQSYKKYYCKPDYSKKYVYFPLHYQPEASTIVCAQKYEKQLFFIDSWAKSLPADTILYVKEHYALVGHREPGFYKELKKFPNVVLIDPFVSSRDMMNNAVAITTLTGTAGWEAMLLRKPVFIGGNIFFDKAPGVIKVDDIYENYLSQLSKWKEPSRDDIILYLCEYFRNIYPGKVYNTDPETYTDKNISLVVDSLWKEIIKNDNKNE